MAFQRDALGRITRRVEEIDGVLPVFGYGYDEAGRLAAMTRNGTLEVAYTDDANGNRLAPNGVDLHSTHRLARGQQVVQVRLNVWRIRVDLPVDATEERRGIHPDMCRLIIRGSLEVMSAIVWSIRSDDLRCLLASREKTQPPEGPDMVRVSSQSHSAIQVLASTALTEALRGWRAEQLFLLVGPESRCLAALHDLSPGIWKATPIDPLASLTKPARGLVLVGTYDALHGGMEVFGADETVLRMMDVARANRHADTSGHQGTRT